MARDGKVHFWYSALASSNPDSMNYERFDAATGVRDFSIAPPSTWTGATLQVTPTLHGFFVSHRDPEISTIYTVQLRRTGLNDSRVMILASDDNGATWYDRGLSDPVGVIPGCTTNTPRCDGFWSLTGSRLVTDDGYIVGLLSTQYAPKHTVFFRAKVANASFGSPATGAPITWIKNGNHVGWTPQDLDGNGDDRGDLGLTVSNASGWMTWLARGDNSGTFDTTNGLWGSSADYSGYIAGKPIDFNLDTRDDIWLTFNNATKWSVFTALSGVNGVPATPTPWQHLGNYAGLTPGSGDFDGDGDGDLVLTTNDASSWRAYVSLWNGSGFAATPLSWSVPGGWGGWTPFIANFDNHPAADLALVHNDNISWRSWVARANGTGTFGTGTYWEHLGNFTGWLRSHGDFNGDGWTDSAGVLQRRGERAHLGGDGTWRRHLPYSDQLVLQRGLQQPDDDARRRERRRQDNIHPVAERRARLARLGLHRRWLRRFLGSQVVVSPAR